MTLITVGVLGFVLGFLVATRAFRLAVEAVADEQTVLLAQHQQNLREFRLALAKLKTLVETK